MSQNRSPNDYRAKGNGNGHETSGQPGGTGGSTDKYKPDDFSQKAINQGQRRINYELVEVGKKLADALEKFKKAIKKMPGGDKLDFREVDEAISDVYEVADAVADIRPPGCDAG